MRENSSPRSRSFHDVVEYLRDLSVDAYQIGGKAN